MTIIDDLRKQIDKVDGDLIHLLAKRMDLVTQIGREKKVSGEAVLQVTRETAVLDKVKLIADTLGLDENFIANLFRAILNESRRVQSRVQ